MTRFYKDVTHDAGAQCTAGAGARADGRFYAAKLVGTGRYV
jgi:hypothetical protein